MQPSYTIWLWLISISLLTACEPAPEYNVSEQGYRWKLLSFSDRNQSVDSAEHVLLEGLILSGDEEDTLDYFYDEVLIEGEYPIYNFLSSRYVGDSLKIYSFRRDSLNDDLSWNDSLVYFLRIDRIRTPRELSRMQSLEMLKLDSLIRVDSVIENYSEFEGIYMRSLREGDTLSVEKGREIVIHYQGRTSAGRVFDDSRRMAAPLRFVYGNEGQVLKGLDIALSRMNRGDVYEIILPSWLAFGARGSADGRVEPFQTVIYRLEVLEVAAN